MRINARLDPEHSQKLEQLRKYTKLSVSDIVKRAIDVMYAQQTADPKMKLKTLLNSDFIGCFSDEPDLSENSEDIAQRILSNKDSH